MIHSNIQNEIQSLSKRRQKGYWVKFGYTVCLIVLLAMMIFFGWVEYAGARVHEWKAQAKELGRVNLNEQVELAEAYYKSIRN